MGKFILTPPWAPVWWMSSKVLDAVDEFVGAQRDRALEAVELGLGADRDGLHSGNEQ